MCDNAPSRLSANTIYRLSEAGLRYPYPSILNFVSIMRVIIPSLQALVATVSIVVMLPTGSLALAVDRTDKVRTMISSCIP